MIRKKDYTIIKLVAEDDTSYNRSIVFYNKTDVEVKQIFNYFTKWLQNNLEDDLTRSIVSKDLNKYIPIINLDRVCIDICVDDYFSDDLVDKVFQDV